MKKVGIVTLYRNNKNYGGLLQAYSTQFIIEKLGFDSQIINYDVNIKDYKKRRFKNLGIKKSFIILSKKIKTKIHLFNKELKNDIDNRNKLFKQFEESIIHSDKVDDSNISEMINDYNYLITGSDQVWNPGLWNDAMFLYFPEYKGKRISYAASVGRSHLNNDENNYIKERIKYFDSVSVREESAQHLIEPLTNKDVKTVLDPTFLVSDEEWEIFSEEIKTLKDKEFVFSFFLHDSVEAKKSVKKFCNENGLLIVTIPHLQGTYKKIDEKYADIKLYDVNPHNWVWLIKNASFVFTDSFHGTAFSINNSKQFICFPNGKTKDKQNINSRLIDLLKLFGLEKRYIISNSISEVYNDTINYDLISDTKDKLINKSLLFLKNSLCDGD